jgi:hypothetical protein
MTNRLAKWHREVAYTAIFALVQIFLSTNFPEKISLSTSGFGDNSTQSMKIVPIN